MERGRELVEEITSHEEKLIAVTSPGEAKTLLEHVEKRLIQEKAKRSRCIDTENLELTQALYEEMLESGWRCGIHGAQFGLNRKDKVLLRVAMKTFLVLSSNSKHPCETETTRATELTLQSLEGFPGDRVIQREGLRTLVNLVCIIPLDQHAVIRCIRICQNAISNRSLNDDRFTLEAALLVCANVGSNSKQQECSDVVLCDESATLFSNLIDTMLDVMPDNSTSQTILTRALQGLANLLTLSVSVHEWDEEKFCSIVLSAMKNFGNAAVLQRYGLMAIVNSLESLRISDVERGESFRHKLFEHGAILTVKQASWAFDLDPIIAKWSKVALENIDV